MCWVYVPGLEASNSGSKLPSLDRFASLTWRGKLMPPLFWRRAWERVPWLPRLSGLMLEPSTLDRGVASWIASLQAIRANPTARRESGSERTTIDGSSTEFSGSSMSCGLLVSSERTSRGMRTANSASSSRHWKQWVTALRLECSQRPPLELPTSESDCSSWQTTRTARGAYTRDNGDPTKERASLEGQAAKWTTPLASEGSRIARFAQGGRPLDGMARDFMEGAMWPTTKAMTGGGNSKRKERGAGGPDLQEAVRNWPTIMASDDGQKATKASYQIMLSNLAPHWSPDCPSPSVQTIRGGSTSSPTTLACYRRLRGMTCSALRSETKRLLRFGIRTRGKGWTREQPAPFVRPAFRRRLNPLFTEWLMGWPIGWTGFEPLETEWSHWLRLSRGRLSAILSPRVSDQPSLL